ncbi:MAG: Ig-like domain-containing protein, partial [Ghiorsea sp.]|nr:Ig-like domain-containing protein [Ghiorsea sp.]
MKLIKNIGVMLFVLMLAGCGNNPAATTTTPTTTTPTTTTPTTTTPTTTTPTAQVVSSLAIKTSQASVFSDGSDSATITATVLDVNSVVIPNAQVIFSADSGAISSGLVTTDAAGVATITVKNGASAAGATITVTASVTGATGAITSSIGIPVVAPTTIISAPVAQAISSLAIKASQATVLSDGSDSVTITATVLDVYSVVIPNAQVTFSSNSGAISSGLVT